MSALTFSRVTQASDEATGQVTPTVTTLEGAAAQMDARDVFRQFGLITSNQIGLMWSCLPANYNLNQRPEPGDTCTWGGQTYTVKDVKPFAPDGVAIYCDVLAER